MSKLEITDIQLFDHTQRHQINEAGDTEIVYDYSANVIINDSFMVQVHGGEHEAGFSIPTGEEIAWNSQEVQDEMFDKYHQSDIEEQLEKVCGFENNIGWLEDNATDIMNPENVKYRRENWGKEAV
jgi:hypothetical protein